MNDITKIRMEVAEIGRPVKAPDFERLKARLDRAKRDVVQSVFDRDYIWQGTSEAIQQGYDGTHIQITISDLEWFLRRQDAEGLLR